ncbi:MAG: GH36 C-terminal domain-containing protein [Ktedonobacteraceae bacterium]
MELPAFVGLYSNKGFEGISRSWHAYEREHVLPAAPEAVLPDCPNFVTKRAVPLRYRFHVAMSGALGIGGDLSHWTPQEQEEARYFIALYKRVRSTIQNGLLYRLRSPRTGGIAASQYVAQDGSEVVVFAWGHSQQFGEGQVSLRLHGLEEEAHYADDKNGATYSGAYLAQQGLPVKLVGDYASHMVHLFRATSTR